MNGLNALHLASKEGHFNVVDELLRRGANVNAATKKGNSALHIAALAGHERIVRALVKQGATVNSQSQSGFTPLYMASQENHVDIVRFLMANGASQTLATQEGFTPMAVAVQQGHDKVIAALADYDSLRRRSQQLPALHAAAKRNDVAAASMLLQGDNDIDTPTKVIRPRPSRY
jgi:ankyrin